MNRPPEITQIEALHGRTFTTLETIGPYSAFRAPIDEPRVTMTPAGSEFPLDDVRRHVPTPAKKLTRAAIA
jgi:hypothetical protein